MNTARDLRRRGVSWLLCASHDLRARHIVLPQIREYLRPGDRILDLGAGPCHVSRLLRLSGFSVSAVDIVDSSHFVDVQVTLYDGCHLPFPDGYFDLSLILTVLHHTRNPEQLLQEAARASRRIIVIEDTFRTVLGRYCTYLFDSLGNFQFKGHPHANRTSAEWRQLFQDLGLKLVDTKERNAMLVFHHTLYSLERRATFP